MINESGQTLVVVFITLGVVLFTVLSMIAGAQIYYQNAEYSIQAESATAIAEAGIDKALASLNKTGGSYSGETETFFGDGSYSVEITTKDTATKIIKASGYLPNKANAKVTRTVQMEASRGVGVSFVYGVQVGEGGMQFGNSNTVEGSIYSNGNITLNNSNTIKGDAWVAGGSQPNPDQETDCLDVNCVDYLFGKNVGGENILDVGMSFKPSVSGTLNKISLKLKKIGNPPDVIVRILSDSDGNPNKNGVLASGTLYSALVTQDFGWIDVTFSTTPNLIAQTSYWLMIDTSASTTNYWAWQNDLAQSYNRGLPKWSPNWSIGSPSWTGVTGDLSFKTFMGGTVTSIIGGNSDKVEGNVHAHTIDNLNIKGDAYFQTIVNSDVDGAEYPGSPDPPPKVFPISDANISQWKQEAQSVGSLSSPVCGSPTPWGPGKFTGNLNIGNSCSVTVKSPIWITGDVNFNNSNTFKLDASYGTGSGVIVVDGRSTFGNSNKLEGTGVGLSLLMLLSTYDSTTNSVSAISLPNSGNSGVLYAGKGIIEPGNSNTFKELTAWGIRVFNSTTVNYETGLSSTLFSSGPGGTYTLVKGTYQVK